MAPAWLPSPSLSCSCRVGTRTGAPRATLTHPYRADGRPANCPQRGVIQPRRCSVSQQARTAPSAVERRLVRRRALRRRLAFAVVRLADLVGTAEAVAGIGLAVATAHRPKSLLRLRAKQRRGMATHTPLWRRTCRSAARTTGPCRRCRARTRRRPGRAETAWAGARLGLMRQAKSKDNRRSNLHRLNLQPPTPRAARYPADRRTEKRKSDAAGRGPRRSCALPGRVFRLGTS